VLVSANYELATKEDNSFEHDGSESGQRQASVAQGRGWHSRSALLHSRQAQLVVVMGESFFSPLFLLPPLFLVY